MSSTAETKKNLSKGNLSKKKKVRRGLARTLFSWFMLLSLAPLIIVGMIEYNNARDSIFEARHEEMSTISLMLSRQIGDYFDDIVVNMHFRSGKAADFLQEIKELQTSNNIEAEDLLSSLEYSEIVGRYSHEFIDLMRFYDYSDVLIGDVDGNLVYSVGRYSDFGQNLFTGELSRSLFAETVHKSIENDQRLYSDQEVYPPAGDEKVSFFVMPLVDDREQPLGFIAAQIWARDDISFLLSQSLGISAHVDAYIVGKDKRIRFYPDRQMFSSEAPLQLAPVKEWLTHFDQHGQYIEDTHGYENHIEEHNHADEHDHEDMVDGQGMNEMGESEANSSSKSHIFVYKNKDGREVLGVSRHIQITDTPMVLIAEMDYNTALAPAILFRNQLLIIISITGLLVFTIAGLITRRITKPVRTITEWANRVAAGEYSKGEIIHQANEIGELSHSFQVMTDRLQSISANNEERNWQQSGVAKLNETIRGEQSMAELCRNIVTALCRYLEIPMGAMYVMADGRRLQMMGSFALSMRRKIGSAFVLGEGLPGQAALEKQALTVMVPEDYFTIESGLGGRTPDRIFVLPLIYEDEVKGVMEFALLGDLSEQMKEFLEAAVEGIAIAINTSQARDRVQELLDKTTHQTQALQQQQEDLRAANEELEHQTRILGESEEELKTQSDELQRANAELEEKSESLFHQKEEIEIKNAEIEQSRKELERKADEMEQVSKYKSEFLANMSHELRTPLNSMLILAKMLADNVEGHLDEDEEESAQVIHKVGHDLLGLINDILDLSKVEAGKLSVHVEPTSLDGMLESMDNQFKPIAKDKNLYFEIVRKTDTAINLHTDSQRVMQILKNLLSNAFKFTEKGGIKLNVELMPAGDEFSSKELCTHGAISLGVQDSGIGIPKEKQGAIFEAFQQADGSTSRKYGGTGLGLSIAREMSRLLGGEMRLFSESGEGSTFSLLLPNKSEPSDEVVERTDKTEALPAPAPAPAPAEEVTEDDRDRLDGDCPILVVEDDPEFARVVFRLAKNHGSKCLIAGTGKEALELSNKHHPRAVILDLGLPDMDGKDVLKTLKKTKETEDIPVHIISGRDADDALLSLGAVDYLMKPVDTQQLTSLFGELKKTSRFEKILVIDPDDDVAEKINTFLGGKCELITAKSAAYARTLIKEHSFNSIILELNLPDESGDKLLQSLKEEFGDSLPPVIINTSEDIDRERFKELGQSSGTMVVKGEESSDQRLKDEVQLFLNSVAKPASKRRKPAVKPVTGDSQLKGRKVLLVDDDLRNTFALSKALQRFEMDITIADNGELALEQLEKNPSIEVVLMDIMMPVMDGYEATKKIREQERFKNLPVIALTAKAMADDRDKCIQAGASDYLTKPVDIDKLVGMLKVWLQGGNGSEA
ncbi:response regulator [Sansalvadorimonas sp. 2012CJ34-2]|uniref:histidine kinase n=1 Tax=Parendozoicomonas callyspongiae TaxID=2942213 RepID=A0ABT0PCG9_9GAMM|nr:response regulator [Sansalvadorimonas sp. 2012CJ34-2]MCL6269075.1 response regulator [Sansalvadorimonas sp. 2012CJ34-2]